MRSLCRVMLVQGWCCIPRLPGLNLEPVTFECAYPNFLCGSA